MAVAKSWVTKTNIVDYSRCPYAFWLVDSGQVPRAGSMSPVAAKLAAEGVAFQKQVEASGVPVALPAVTQGHTAPAQVVEIFGDLPVFVNRSLRTRGTPDGVVPGDGAWYPVEVKSHKRPSALDRTELAFYWALLAPRRTSFPDPEGLLVLRKGGAAERVRVSLAPADFDEVHRLIAAVRTARAEGVPPRVCRCQVCSQRPEVITPGPVMASGLSMIFGIAWTYSKALGEMGCHRHDQLAALDSAEVVEFFRSRGFSVSAGIVEGWKLHARSYAERLAVLAAHREHLPALDRYIALDLEWDMSGQIWLVGAGLVEGGAVAEHWYRWADSPAEEQAALVALGQLLAEHPGLPVVTWNGKGADLPRLAKRAEVLAPIEGLAESLAARHFDLYLWAQKYFRLPGPGLTLKEVARAFGLKANSG